MYLKHFGLEQNPFSLAGDPRYLVFSECHTHALAALLYALQERRGLGLLLGEPGTGKTMIIRSLTRMLKPTRLVLSTVMNPFVETREEFLETVLQGFGVRGTEPRVSILAERLTRELQSMRHQDRIPVLVIDEAQSLNRQLLECVRLLTNLELNGEKILQIVLSGQPELEQRLESFDFRALQQRVSVCARLRALTAKETFSYVHVRLQAAGYRGGSLFSDDAIAAVFRYSEGIPRLINTLANNSLVAAFGDDASSVSERIIHETAAQMGMHLEQPSSTEEDLIELGFDRDHPDNGVASAQFERFLEPWKANEKKERF